MQCPHLRTWCAARLNALRLRLRCRGSQRCYLCPVGFRAGLRRGSLAVTFSLPGKWPCRAGRGDRPVLVDGQGLPHGPRPHVKHGTAIYSDMQGFNLSGLWPCGKLHIASEWNSDAASKAQSITFQSKVTNIGDVASIFMLYRHKAGPSRTSVGNPAGLWRHTEIAKTCGSADSSSDDADQLAHQ